MPFSIHPNDQLEINLTLRNHLATRLFEEARRRGKRPVDLLADIIENVIADDLFAAVLED